MSRDIFSAVPVAQAAPRETNGYRDKIFPQIPIFGRTWRILFFISGH
jgi:hypothetical protein